ncbi:DUF2950 domain-containing protein [Rhizobium sp. S96]|uniref:DUF2950 domain-containing protein n=1 Tax=Rhizobium sp. S96 TaxID=3055140 RepID=UPI0025AAF299|nr:DUF2950 domain-containing protein [Rhizobium sp. S96]MDM9620858.1 DUF2950 domain-containing protein [Rhizobium sp. S96]
MIEHDHRMISRSIFGSIVVSVLLLAGTGVAADRPAFENFVSKQKSPEYATADDAMAAFKDAVAASDLDKLAALLGVDAAKLKATEGVTETLAAIKEGAVKRLSLETNKSGQSVIDVGDEQWPFPFPITKREDGKWAFDPVAGIEEIINRRIGENELQTILTMRAYVDAQEEYALHDHDGDGVLEYAQKLISTPGKTDGLFWPPGQSEDASPAGPILDYAQLKKAKDDKGYFGYRYKILTRQGANIAGGAYDYIINGNMIAGFALVAWPVKYGETGVQTFVVNRNGIVYQADLGADTSTIASRMKSFNPGDKWQVTDD